jgi:hypothetical protein
MVDLIYLYSTNSPTGVTAADLRRIRRDSGAVRTENLPRVPHRKWTRLSEDARVNVAERYEAGATTTELAGEYGVANSTIIGRELGPDPESALITS